ncbi:MAG: hypothetical protein H0T64_09180 [Pyrinomonadaceae bacterium]|nr:hypothetical protein [Pyrinomonadaceae bacterium]
MKYDQETVRTFYKKLLILYPRAFRDLMGESMEQTFNDLWTERRRQTERGLFGYVLWIFVETSIGIIKERVLLITQRNTMKNITATLGSAALISFILVLPFAILEALNNTITKQNAPGLILLFGLLWLLPTAFIVILVPIVRTVRAGNSIVANPINLLLRVAFLVLIAMTWGWGLIDQLPCFLGVPNCD